MRGLLTVAVVALVLASGAVAGPASAAADAGIGTSTALGTATADASTTDGATVNDTTDGDATVNDTTDDDTTDTVDDTTGTVDRTGDATDWTTTDGAAAVDGSGRTVTGEATASVDDANVSLSATADASGTVAVSADSGGSPSVDGDRLPVDTAPSSATGSGTPTERSGGNASAGPGAGNDGATGPSSESDGGVPVSTGGAVVVGFGAAAVALLARRSATLAAVAPDVAAALSRLPSPFAPFRHAIASHGWLWRLLGLFGYSRYDGSDPLEHETRAELYDLVADTPGTYLSELSERAGVPTSTIRHHLDVLEDEGLVTSSAIRGRRRYFPLDAENEALLAALETDASAAVLEYLALEGPDSVSAIAAGLDRDVSTVSHHLRRLAEDDLVERERDGRSVQNRLAAEVAEALDRAGESRPRPGRAGINA